MTMDVSPELQGAVGALLEQRAQLQGWLSRLDELSGGVPDRIAERVRSDYTERLRGVTESLSGHRESITAQMESLRHDLAQAEARFATSGDALEEARLRFQIGELEAEHWDTRRPELETELAEADRASGDARQAVEQWQQLLNEIEGVPARPAPAPQPAAPAPAAAPAASRPTPAAPPARKGRERGASEPPAPAQPAAPAQPVAPARNEDMAFLQELDRAIAASGTSSRTPDSAEVTLEEPAPVAAASLTCNECGSVNDPQAWYCEVCGVEL